MREQGRAQHSDAQRNGVALESSIVCVNLLLGVLAMILVSGERGPVRIPGTALCADFCHVGSLWQERAVGAVGRAAHFGVACLPAWGTLLYPCCEGDSDTAVLYHSMCLWHFHSSALPGGEAQVRVTQAGRWAYSIWFWTVCCAWGQTRKLPNCLRAPCEL